MRVLPVLSLLLLTGCPEGDEHDHDHHHHDDDTSDTAHHDYATSAHSDGGAFYVEYTPNPDPIPVSDEFSVTLTVYEGVDTEAVLSGVDRVAVDADMPEHGHGMNVVPEVADNGDGTFTASPFAFHMPGYWEIYVDVTVGDTTERATFSVDCCD